MKLRSHKRKEKVLPNRKREAMALELQVFCTQAVGDGRKQVKLRNAAASLPQPKFCSALSLAMLMQFEVGQVDGF